MKPQKSPSLETAVLVTVGLTGMLIPLNSTMIAVALPRISRDLHASVVQTGWLVTAYLITMAALQPVSGKLGDRYGRRPFLLGGMAVFALTSIGAALSPTIWALVAFRAGQAVSGAVMFPNGIALLRQIVPEVRRGARFGMLGSAISFGAGVGPPLGGVLVELGGWPAIFWVNVPLLVAIILLGWRTLPAAEPRHTGERFDAVGAALLSVVLAAGAWLLTRLRDVDAGTATIVGVVIAVAFVLFLVREFRYPDPVVQPRFFRRGAFAAATGAIALSNLSMYAVLLAVPLLLHQRHELSDARIGLVLTSMSAGMVFLAPIGGRLSDRLGRRRPAVAGMTLLAIGLSMLAMLGADVPTSNLIICLVLTGTGLGLGAGSLQTSAVETIEPEHAGMAAAASATSRYLGSIVGSAVLVGLASSPGGFQAVFTMTAISAGLAAVLATALPTRRRRHQRTSHLQFRGEVARVPD